MLSTTNIGCVLEAQGTYRREMNDKWEKRLIETTFDFAIQVVSSIRKQGFLKTKLLIKFEVTQLEIQVFLLFLLLLLLFLF